jgi:AraC-like DNA-binding protein
LSKTISIENNFWGILAENYNILSEIEDAKGNTKKALKNIKKYTNIKDSIFNVEKFGEINQLQRFYEVSKTNQQIEELIIDQQVKERTIHYQNIIRYFAIIIIITLSIVLSVIVLQKRKLKKAYKVLFEKNIKLDEIQDKTSEISETELEENIKHSLDPNLQNDLLNKIYTVMEDTSTICDTNFTINKLATLVESNQKYVSQAINDALNKKFRLFLNSYRIKEAQKLFLEKNAEKYTIEFVALHVGFKSRSAFISAFKEFTGLSPFYYLKSLQEKERIKQLA